MTIVFPGGGGVVHGGVSIAVVVGGGGGGTVVPDPPVLVVEVALVLDTANEVVLAPIDVCKLKLVLAEAVDVALILALVVLVTDDDDDDDADVVAEVLVVSCNPHGPRVSFACKQCPPRESVSHVISAL